MTFTWKPLAVTCLAGPALVLMGCRNGDAPGGVTAAPPPDHAPEPGETNRIDIPGAVRQNLGLTFVKAEVRHVERTIRVPGRFEYLPTAKREYRTMLPGRVDLLVEQFDRVEAGTPLFAIDSPAWRSHQQQLTEAEATIERLTTRVSSYGPLRAAHHNHERQLAESIAIRRERVEQLEGLVAAGGGRMGELSEARGAVSTAEADLAEVLEKEAELEADEAATRSSLAAASTSREFLLESAASLLRTTVASLREEVDTPQGRQFQWRTIRSILVRAEDAGSVESLGLTNGAWADEKTAVLTVVAPNRLRFRGVGLQSDLGLLRDGLPARIVAPSPTRAAGSIDLADTMTGSLTLGLSGNPDERTVDLLVVPETLASWARAGVSAQLEIVTDATSIPSLAVPKAAVQRDGLVPVIFLRDPADADKAIRLEADLGIDDGRWIVVHSGLQADDEIVLDGAFQLMLASSSGGGMSEGGHFHADGTFHAGDE